MTPDALAKLRALYEAWPRYNGDVPDSDYQDGYMDACEACASELRAILDGAEGEDWRPIETAPKDGTNFLACSPASSVFYAHWANGVVDSSSWMDEFGYQGRHATVWQPLPEPPGAPR